MFRSNPSFDTFLTTASRPAIGSYAEALVAQALYSRGFSVSKLHTDGADLNVDGQRVDVKAVRHLKRQATPDFRRVPILKCLNGVTYAYAIFWHDSIEVRSESGPAVVPNLSFPIDLSAAVHCWDIWHQTAPIQKPVFAANYKTIQKELRLWCKKNWSKKVRVIYRGDRLNNEAMLRRRWGADNFYEKHPERTDAVALLYVDGGGVYEVWAYPVAEQDKIIWKHKAIGPNPTNIPGYDPQKLDTRFRFRGLEEFKLEFHQRFPHFLSNPSERAFGSTR